MANMLLEKYSKKIKLAESVYANAHNGEKMGQMQKMTVAKCLDNVSKFFYIIGFSTSATWPSLVGLSTMYKVIIAAIIVK